MADTSRLRVLYLSHLSKPASDRSIYRAICRERPKRILELGIGTGVRAARMIELARHASAARQVRFCGIDMFEARSAAEGPGITLKMAHRQLAGTGARIHLVPGDPFVGLSRTANTLGQVDLVVISARHDPEQLARAWFYVPRLLHERSHVFVEEIARGARPSMRLLDRTEIGRLAGSRRAA